MTTAYYATERREILPFLPERVERLLDIGCGTGATTAAIRRERAVVWAGGIEYEAAVAEQARPHLQRLWVGDATAIDFASDIESASLDLVLCLDVLEHLADPWTLVRRLTPLLRPGGRLILSVPNIRNWKFIWRLAVKGDFRYRDFGLLDRTHLRFFVRETAIALALAGGGRLVDAHSVQAWPAWTVRGGLNRLTSGRSDEFFAKQWMVVAERQG